MIVNDRYRFIFVHVPKSGGNSVAEVLQQLDGTNPLCVSTKTKHETIAQFADMLDHRRAASDLASAKTIQGYRLFGFVRHPWDRVASLYRYLVEKRPRSEIDSIGSFAEFLKRAVEGEPWIRALHSMRLQSDFFQTDASPELTSSTYIGHFETLADDFKRICGALGIPFTSLPHRNRSSNSGADYRSAYDDATIECVASLFAEDIERFHYSFEQPVTTRHLLRERLG